MHMLCIDNVPCAFPRLYSMTCGYVWCTKNMFASNSGRVQVWTSNTRSIQQAASKAWWSTSSRYDMMLKQQSTVPSPMWHKQQSSALPFKYVRKASHIVTRITRYSFSHNSAGRELKLDQETQHLWGAKFAAYIPRKWLLGWHLQSSKILATQMQTHTETDAAQSTQKHRAVDVLNI